MSTSSGFGGFSPRRRTLGEDDDVVVVPAAPADCGCGGDGDGDDPAGLLRVVSVLSRSTCCCCCCCSGDMYTTTSPGPGFPRVVAW